MPTNGPIEVSRERITITLPGTLSVRQAAELVHRSYVWLHQRIGKEGGPPYRRIGGRYAIPTEEFLKWANQDNIP